LPEKAVLIIQVENGNVSVNIQGNIAPANLVYAIEIAKKMVLERSQQAAPIYDPRLKLN
jgi:hypothetical protein